MSYTLAPQREGNLTITPAQLKIATRANTRDMWGSFMPQVKWKSYYSNSVTITAKSLPNNAKLVGNFTISAVADKQEIAPNEAVNVTVSVQGDGNLEDIESFKPYIEGVNVFDEKIEIHGNTLTQKLAFVSDRDFTIPPFKLAFYNLKTKRVEQIRTKAIHIKVKGAKEENMALKVQKSKEEPLHIQKADARSEVEHGSVNYIWLIVTFIFGMVAGAALMIKKPLLFTKQSKKFTIKNEKLLLLKLLPYRDEDVDVKKIVDALEANLYTNTKEKIDKKLLKEVLKRYDIS
jgi:hypothetical protein